MINFSMQFLAYLELDSKNGMLDINRVNFSKHILRISKQLQGHHAAFFIVRNYSFPSLFTSAYVEEF